MAFTLGKALPPCLLFCALGCQQAVPPSKQRYDKVQLGMSFNDAKMLFAKEGKQFEHDKLPAVPLPRLGYKGIPEATTWFIWWDEKTGHPITLGVLEGRVIYKEGTWDENGQVKGMSETLPEYQK